MKNQSWNNTARVSSFFGGVGVFLWIFFTPTLARAETMSFSAGPGDGFVYNQDVSWSRARAAEAGDIAWSTSSTSNVSSGNLTLERAFLTFDSSGLPDDAVLLSAKLKIYISSKTNNDNDGKDWITLVKATPAGNTTLGVADYKNCGTLDNPLEGISRKDISLLPIGQYLTVSLNTNGVSWISRDGYTTFGLREGHDVLNDVPQGTNKIIFSASEQSGTSRDPILEVTYSLPVPPPPSPTSTPVVVDVLQDITYQYDKVGNITKITDASDTLNAKSVVFTYDGLNRLASASTTNATTTAFFETYGYSPTGNIANKSDVGSYAYTGNIGTNYANPQAVTAVAGIAYFYDRNGNLKQDGRNNYVWDYRDRLMVSGNAAATSTYGYDFLNQRVKQVTATSTRLYPNSLYNVSGSTKTMQILADGRLIATVEKDASDNTVYVHTDHLAGSSVMTNAQGQLVEATDYYPFGAIRIDYAPTGFNEQKKFTGHEFDTLTGLTYMGARYYPGKQARFLSQDPMSRDVPQRFLADPQQLNLYGYARNNPLKYLDPTGLLTVIIPGTNYDAKAWSEKGEAQEFISSVSKTFRETRTTMVVNNKSIWSGGDNDRARQSAAENIAKIIESYSFAEGEKLNIIGHSHGGNVGIILSNILNRKIDNLVTLATPVRSDYQPSIVNVGRHINVYSNLDSVQALGNGKISLSEVIGQAVFRNIGGQIGRFLSWGEYGPAGRTFFGAENIVATRESFSPDPIRLHGNLWRSSSIWSRVGARINP